MGVNKSRYRFLCVNDWKLNRKMAALLLALLAIYGCKTPEEETHVTVQEKPYFDLATEIRRDIDSNTFKHCGEEKFVLIDGVKESRKIDTVNWEEELKPLLECDINKPAWKGKFLVDTFQSSVAGLTTISYRALSDRVNVKSLIVDFDKQRIRKIRITKKINSFIFSSVQVIEYIPAVGFVLMGEQKAFMMKSFELNVQVKYSCK